MKKFFGLVVAFVLLALISFQVQAVNAEQNDENHLNPVTSPCKPGWGYGDKNHCHSGPPGQN